MLCKKCDEEFGHPKLTAQVWCGHDTERDEIGRLRAVIAGQLLELRDLAVENAKMKAALKRYRNFTEDVSRGYCDCPLQKCVHELSKLILEHEPKTD